MTGKSKRAVYVIIGLLISLVLIWALFRNVNFGDLMQALSNANYWWLIPNIILVISAMHQRAWRWQFMLEPIKRVSFDKLLSATCIGFMANNVLPLRLGEFVRAYSLSWQDKEVSKSTSLATIFVERMVFDLVVLLMIFGAVIGLSQLSLHEDMREGTYLAVGIAVVGIAFILALAFKPGASGALLSRALFWAPASVRSRINDVVLRFSHGLDFIKNVKTLSIVAGLTMLLWVLMGLSNYFVFKAFGFDLPISASFVLLVVVSISILIPSSPGFVGVYHAGTVWTLAQYPGISKEQALSFALVLHAAQYIPITAMGFYYLKKEHLSLKTLEEEATVKTE